MSQIELSESEETAIRQILSKMSERAKYPISIESLLKRWDTFVTQVEKGYEDSIYDYANDLSVRDLLDKILLGAPQSLRAKLIALLQPLDDRFKQASLEVRRPVVTRDKGAIAFWWFRVPCRPGPELRQDLRSEGLI